jgi:hypothetical protein
MEPVRLVARLINNFIDDIYTMVMAWQQSNLDRATYHVHALHHTRNKPQVVLAVAASITI